VLVVEGQLLRHGARGRKEDKSYVKRYVLFIKGAVNLSHLFFWLLW